MGDLAIRIHITGNAGAGKTTLASSLGEALGVPVYSLDPIVWSSGWKKTPPEQRRIAVRELTERPSWIIEGVSPTVRQASDLILFLDVPRYICAARGLKRSLRYFTRTRPGLPENCPEYQIIPRLLQIIRKFPANAGRSIHREAERDPIRYRIIRHPDEVRSHIAEFLAANPRSVAARNSR